MNITAQNIKISTEHFVKHVGTFISTFYPFVIGFLLITVDFLNISQFCPKDESALCGSLFGILNIFVSILTTILLTTFSVIFVVMQLASSQFSPRILRYFLANDLKIQQFIGLFIGTITLCLLPQIATVFFKDSFIVTTVAGLIFSLHCLLWSFPRMITYLSENVNVASITKRIKTETVNEINTLYQDFWEVGQHLLYKRSKTNLSKFNITIISPFESGYLDKVDYVQLSQLYQQFLVKNPDFPKFVVYQKPIIGEFILAKTTNILTIELNDKITDVQIEKIKQTFTQITKEAFSVNKFRSYTQDINFGVRKLVDIGIKAISPAVNDPTTCINCIDYLGEIIRELSIRKFPSSETTHLQADRIIINEFNFEELVDISFDQIYQWGKNDPTIIKRILRTIKQIIPFTSNPYCLKVLIKQIAQMEIDKIYKTTPQLPESNFSQEQIASVLRELTDFKAQCKLQIQHLENEGILKIYAQKCTEDGEKTAIRKTEIETVEYLRAY
jgi:uncharacterized membrane protein